MDCDFFSLSSKRAFGGDSANQLFLNCILRFVLGDIYVYCIGKRGGCYRNDNLPDGPTIVPPWHL